MYVELMAREREGTCFSESCMIQADGFTQIHAVSSHHLISSSMVNVVRIISSHGWMSTITRESEHVTSLGDLELVGGFAAS